MAKVSPKENKQKKQKTIQKKVDFDLEPKTKRGIAVIFLFAAAGISILSLFDLAGQAGTFIDNALNVFFGWANFLFPLILILWGYFLLNPAKYNLKATNYLGLFLFFLSLNGLLHLSFRPEEALSRAFSGEGGGYIGLLLSYPLLKIMGFWAGGVVLVALFLISILLTFNTSIESLIQKSSFGKKIYQNLKLFFLGLKFGGRNIEESPENGVEKIEESDSEMGKEKEIEPSFVSKNIQEKAEGKEGGAFEISLKFKRPKIDIPMDLLDGSQSKPTSGDIRAQMQIIEKTLVNFGIQVEMGEISVGPTVTQFTLKPAEGIKLSQITTLHNDLALALASHPIRIEAPIPGKSLVGIEVPNRKVAVVNLKEVLSSSEFKHRKSNLMVALGKDVAGQNWVADLDKMPHLLVAGATGSGKSVCLNSILISLLYQNSPDDLKLILIDPKRVEFTVYNGVPHLLTPVITDVKKTINAFKWAITEMDRRFELLSKHGKRDIHAYNSESEDKMSYIVLMVDELADLMSVAAPEVEAAIIRLAQMARAVGIHLVLATQRPSVDIITGLIKANITSRIAFSVASAIDSRTILDTSGAEKLLGRGDMLYICPELSRPKRLQGAFVGDQEIKKVTDFLRQKGEPAYLEEVIELPKRAISGFDFDGSDDELLLEAKDVIFEAGKASASLLQRRLKVGYARAARLLDLLEEQGIIGPSLGAKPREILVKEVKEEIPSDNCQDTNCQS